ncbi:MAG: Uma2 family endonuclease [Phormidium sp. GEM2.Bin31]|nr:Uma2 family endonuclease [Phormidium sp. BM_Day4_Bin.17]TVR06967.1 MAG: Uma2 family endonuclease [Phormidium sp. GEM2.Bin31]UCJ14001.1 MAG: Uma2 family endonuclease [Phormidium sp. PBR-2020]
MVQVQPRLFESFEDYLVYSESLEGFYELYNGQLVKMPPESGVNVQIASFLFLQFARLIDYRRVRGQGLEIEVQGEPRNRYPDLTILREEHIEQLARRNTVRLSMNPPLLVVEVVSPGEVQRQRDYVAKRFQYQSCGIPEYWLIDPEAETVLVLELREGSYQEIGTFTGETPIQSFTISDLDLTAGQVFLG